MATFDLGTIGRRRAGHQPCGLLLDPAKRGDVVVRTEQDARLARSGLGREIGLPLDEMVRAALNPAREYRRVAVAHRPLQHGPGEAVDLEKDDPGNISPGLLSGVPRDALDDPEGVGVVVVRPEDNLQHDGHRRGKQGGDQRPPERVDVDRARRYARRDLEHQRIEQEHEHESRDEGEREPQCCDHRRQQRVQDRDQSRGDDRPAEAGDMDSGHDERRHQQRRARDQPREDQTKRPDPRASWRPRGHLAVRLSISVAPPSSPDRLQAHCLTRSQHADVDIGRQLRCEPPELVHSCLVEVRSFLSADERGRVRAPVDRHGHARFEQAERLRRAARIEMAGGRRGPQPEIGSRARSSGASSAIPENRSVSPAKYTRLEPSTR